ncbi:acyltransferase [Vibrio crassostreae]|uniref:acyltransferase n=1 Tax=Vibrio crassostreae TaxID=246167 RepID=UPI001B300DB2|nr:acyltransferase [Vibrio crassostreae]
MIKFTRNRLLRVLDERIEKALNRAKKKRKYINLSPECSELKLPSSAKLIGAVEIKTLNNKKDNTVTVGENTVLNNVLIDFCGSDCNVKFGDNVRFTGHIIVSGDNRSVRIGDRTNARGVYILAREANVSIGEDCLLSREIELRTTDVHKIYSSESGKRLNEVKSDLVIEDKVWVAAGVLVTKNVKVGKGSVIGARSLVTKDVPRKTVVGGIPARIIHENITWER